MVFPILVQANNGHFTASLVGVPNLTVEEPTRAQAIAALRVEIQQRIDLGELSQLEVDTIGISQLAGKYKDDPTLRELSEQTYQLRDAER